MNLQPSASSAAGDTRSRYPGVRPFGHTPDDVARFFGRTEESEKLYLRILSVPLLVQFGKSGLGKTSLLQAGLFPRLRQKPFLPVMVRLNAADEPVGQAVAHAIQRAGEAEGLELSTGPADGLWELLAATTVWRDELLLTPVLVFDQFEEVFTLRDAAFRAELATELGALASGKAPERLQISRSGAVGELRTPPDVRIVISLREDYLGALEEFSAAIPGLFHERLRLEPLTEDEGREATTKPAQLLSGPGEEPYWSPRFEFEPAALDAMIAYLKGHSGVIEPFQLQLLCRHAEAIAFAKRSAPGGGIKLTLADFSGTQDFASILKNFYRGTLRKLPRAQRTKTEELCEEGLLNAAGHRLMLEEEQVRGEFGITDNTLNTLSRERLIRRERRLESVFYEISHDRLAEAILQSRRFRLPRNVRRWVYPAAIVVTGVVVGVVLLLVIQTQQRMRERQLFLNSVARFTTELADKFRFVPGTTGIMRAIVTENDRLGNELARPEQTWLAAFAPQWLLGDAAGAQRRLNVANMILTGDIQLNAGRLREAEATYEKALNALLDLVNGGNNDAELQSERSAILSKLGLVLNITARPEQALKKFREAAYWARPGALAGADGYQYCTSAPSDLAHADQALDEQEAADAKWKHDCTIALSGLAQANQALSDEKAAVAASRARMKLADQRVSEIDEKMREQDEGAKRERDYSEWFFWRRELALSRAQLGNIALAAYRQLKPGNEGRAAKLKEARGFFVAMLEAGKKLAKENPDNISALIALDYARMLHGNFQVTDAVFAAEKSRGGDALRKDLKDAASQISKACELFESLNRTDPANYWWKLVGSQCAGNAADAEVKAGEYKEAEKHYQRAIELQERISKDDDRFVQPLRDLARSHEKLGDAFWEHAKKEKEPAATDHRVSALNHYRKSKMSWEAWREKRVADAPHVKQDNEYDEALKRLDKQLGDQDRSKRPGHQKISVK